MNYIEVKIKTEADGSDLRLDSMSLNAADTFIKIITSLRNIVEFEANPNLRLGVKEGSACARINDIDGTSSLEVVGRQCMKVVRNEKDRNNVYVSNLKVLKEAIHSELDIDVNYVKEGKEVSLLRLFDRDFKTKKSEPLEQSFKVEFFNSKVTLSGGESSINFHITDAGVKYTIESTEAQAQKAASSLFNEIAFTAWPLNKKNKIEYICSDIFLGNDVAYFHEFKQFISYFMAQNIENQIESVRKQLYSYYNIKDYRKARRFINLFKYKTVDSNILLTILLYSKGFKNNDEMKPTLQSIEEILSKKTKTNLI